MNRRSLLKSASLLPFVTANGLVPSVVERKRSVRFAYMGDTHITDQTKPMEAITKAMHHAQNQADKPQFFLHGGDVIMDALAQDKDKVQKQWNAWNTVVKASSSLPVEYCIGNHDVWGFAGAKTDPLYGKKWAVDQMGISNRYRSFDRNGWHFVIVDSTQLTPGGTWYTANVDPEQMDWLRADLAKTDSKTPVLVLSHIPILSATQFYDRNTVKNGNWVIPGGWNHTDAVDLVELFYQYPNVKAALSGHMHLLDHCTYNNVQYFLQRLRLRQLVDE